VVLPPWAFLHKQFPYIYAGDINIANGVTAQLDIITEPDAHFLVEGIEIIPPLTALMKTRPFKLKIHHKRAVVIRSGHTSGHRRERRLAKIFSRSDFGFPIGTLQIVITNNIGSTRQFYVVLHDGRFMTSPWPKQPSSCGASGISM